MVRAAETSESQRLTIVQIRQLQSPVADRAGAQQRGGFDVRIEFGNRISVVLVDGHVLGVAAVGVAARRAKVGTEVFVHRTCRRMDPSHADAVPFAPFGHRWAEFRDAADDFVSRHHWQIGRRRTPLDLVELGVTYAARGDANLDFVRAGLGHRQVREDQRRLVIFQRRDFGE